MPQFRCSTRTTLSPRWRVPDAVCVHRAGLLAAVIVIAFTRCMTIALTSARVYDDLRHLGAPNAYLFRAVRRTGQPRVCCARTDRHRPDLGVLYDYAVLQRHALWVYEQRTARYGDLRRRGGSNIHTAVSGLPTDAPQRLPRAAHPHLTCLPVRMPFPLACARVLCYNRPRGDTLCEPDFDYRG